MMNCVIHPRCIFRLYLGLSQDGRGVVTNTIINSSSRKKIMNKTLISTYGAKIKRTIKSLTA